MERVLDSTRTLLENRPFSQISINDICIAADVSPSTIYARFRTKRAILEALFDEHERRVAALQEQLVAEFVGASDIRRAVSSLAWGWFRFLVVNDPVRRALATNPDTRRQNDRIIAATRGLLDTVLPGLFPHLDRRQLRGLFVAVRAAGSYIELTVEPLGRSTLIDVGSTVPEQITEDVEHLIDMLAVYAESVMNPPATVAPGD